MIDRHVTDSIKHEVKHSFEAYGADLGDVMGQSHRSISRESSMSRKKKAFPNVASSKRTLMRKMTLKMSMKESKTVDFDETGSNASVGKPKKMSSMKTTIFGSD